MNLASQLKKTVSKPVPLCLLVLLLLLLLIVMWSGGYQNRMFGSTTDVFDEPETAPLLFVGGHPRSGTTLLRVMLDAHPMIRCGAETMTVKPLFLFRNNMSKRDRLWAREAGVYPDLLDRAIAEYILTIVRYMGPPADILCYKRPLLLEYMDQLAKMFPRAKFVHILRDGRAVAASSLELAGASSGNARPILQTWSDAVVKIMRKCQELTEKRCLTIRYEHFVVDPETYLRTINGFLGIPWDPVVLRHHKMLKNITQLNKYEPSTARVKQKIDAESLIKWYTNDRTPDQYLRNVDKDFPLLRALGFIQYGKPPDYSRLSIKPWLNVSEFQ